MPFWYLFVTITTTVLGFFLPGAQYVWYTLLDTPAPIFFALRTPYTRLHLHRSASRALFQTQLCHWNSFLRLKVQSLVFFFFFSFHLPPSRQNRKVLQSQSRVEFPLRGRVITISEHRWNESWAAVITSHMITTSCWFSSPYNCLL